MRLLGGGHMLFVYHDTCAVCVPGRVLGFRVLAQRDQPMHRMSQTCCIAGVLPPPPQPVSQVTHLTPPRPLLLLPPPPGRC